MDYSESNNLRFKGGNPGAVQYGNFINYYQFHLPEERINLLPKNIWRKQGPCIALDIGCNAGNLTAQLKKFLMENCSLDTSILGIDIDPLLIKRAEELTSERITFQCLDIMNAINRNKVINIYLKDKNVETFSVIFCFSTTMWIHLNHGDSGLRAFLKYICSIADLVIVEPQPWKCYKAAVKRMKRCNFTFPAFSKIEFRETVEIDIENILSNDCNMLKIAESERTTWDRKVLIFKNPKLIL